MFFRYFLVLLVFTVAKASAQEHMIPDAQWSKRYYISDQFCAARKLAPGESNGLLLSWYSGDKGNGLFRVVDMRWIFENEADAVQYMKLNMPNLSETGDPLKEKINIGKVKNLYVFNEGAGMRKLNESMGTKYYSYLFLFTVKNFMAKTYVSSENPLTLSTALIYAREAARRLNAAVGK